MQIYECKLFIHEGAQCHKTKALSEFFRKQDLSAGPEIARSKPHRQFVGYSDKVADKP